MKSSFVRKAPIKRQCPPGTKLSVHNGQLLVSSGLHDLDEILGGGLAVGTLFLLEEDQNTNHYLLLSKFFLAEGAACNHSVLVANVGEKEKEREKKESENDSNGNEDDKDGGRAGKGGESDIKNNKKNNKNNKNNELLCDLPTVHVSAADVEREEQATDKPAEEDLKIAWRYKNLTQQKNNSDIFCHHFDFAHRLSLSQMIDANKLHLFSLSPFVSECENHYAELYSKCYHIIQQYNSQNRTAGSNVDKISILRIVIHSFANPMWRGEEVEMLKFMHAMRGLLRSSLAVCLITFPSHLYTNNTNTTTFNIHNNNNNNTNTNNNMNNSNSNSNSNSNNSLVKKMRHLSDYAVALVSFAGTRAKVPPAFSEYKGFFYIHKIPRINSLVPPIWQDTHTLGFKLKRYKMIIEKINLPPEEGRAGDSGEQQSKNQNASSLLCTTGTKPSPIDF